METKKATSRNSEEWIPSLVMDVDNSQEPGKLPGCERDFSSCKRQKLPEKELTLSRMFVEECQ